MIVLEKNYKFKINLLLSTQFINFLNIDKLNNWVVYIKMKVRVAWQVNLYFSQKMD